ncbi:MAG TPA: PIG-L family deacetylase [Opitutaceae bacterium]|nr:PIG-L family deacetylase [Opitutaceae bacterium]
MIPSRLSVFLACGLAALVALPLRASIPEPMPVPSILEELRSFRQMGSVLMIAAHPDDENTQLIAYLSRGRNYRMAYLSVTRGDGGQNEIGPELGAELGLARTQELLAARRVDGGRQFFTRALDFGYSKSPTEALAIWDRQQVLSDVVRVIRTFRPDVLVTRFSPLPANTHGHHTASAILGLEAFRLAGDPKSFPEQIAGGLAPWQPKRILMNGGGGPRGGAMSAPSTPGLVRIDIGGNDPVSGDSFSLIAARSRGMHKTQGFGVNGALAGRSGPQLESFQLLDGDPASGDIMDGIDTTWARVPGGAEIGKAIDDIVTKFNQQDPAASVPALLAMRTKLAALPADRLLDEKRQQLDRILQACLGLSVDTELDQAEVVPGEQFKLHHAVMVRSQVPVRWVGVRYPALGETLPPAAAVSLVPGQAATREATVALPPGTPVSQPYWLRHPPTAGMFIVDDPKLIGRPENPPAFPVELVFETGGQTFSVPDEPVLATPNPGKAETRRRLDVIAPVTLHFTPEVRLFAPGASRPVEVAVKANRPGAEGTLQLDAPAGWKVSPAQPFRLAAVGDQAKLTFTVTAPATLGTKDLTVEATINGQHFNTDRAEIRYDHIPLQLLQPPARIPVVSIDLAVRGRKVGYLPGSGDDVGECLAEMGYEVKPLTGADLTPAGLLGLDAVVIGVRAFNERTDLAANLPGLFAYVEAGGTVVAQYNRPERLRTTKLGPYDLSIAGDAPSHRVTDENSPVSFLLTDHPALTTPNRITPSDFQGWVQERGAYFPSSWDKQHYQEVIALNDPGEAPLTSGILVAKHGSGYFVYTGLGFFRQLPAGVPGAYRLFANLVSLGK